MNLTPHPLTLRQLQYIVAVADRKSFRKAAEDCHVSQPSLSAQVAQAEDALGVRLFESDRRHAIPPEVEWVSDNCEGGPDLNPKEAQRTRESKDDIWKTVIKMTLITRDMMVGNPRQGDLGFKEEALGRNAILAGLPGLRQHWPPIWTVGNGKRIR